MLKVGVRIEHGNSDQFSGRSDSLPSNPMSIPRDCWNWLRRQLVDDVPQGDAVCEFDCRKPQCTMGEWDTCERRVRRAAGELMPDKKPAASTPARSSRASKRDWQI